MEKIVVISDSFKGTISSRQICQIAGSSIPAFFPECNVVSIPVADGGEGTVACFLEAIDAVPVTIPTTGPYEELIEATYARSGDRAIIEMASAAGLPMVGERRNPAVTTTFGVGSIIRHAIENGCREILLGLGGSATNDGGCGCAAALGVKFFDKTGKEFIPVGSTLNRIARIDSSKADILLNGVEVTVMCDVENPLYGTTGAAYIFGPQKGADPDMVQLLDDNLRALDSVLQRELKIYIADIPGAGAAGGMGAGCMAFLHAQLKSGIDAVLDMVSFDTLVRGADLVITGEGRIDSQSIRGKVISGIAKRTSKRNVPLVAIVGSIDDSAQAAYDLGVTAMFGIDREAVAFETYAHKSAEQYRKTLEDVLRLIKAVWLKK